MVAVIYQKAPYAIFSLRSGANVTRAEQLENLEIASGAGSFTQKVIEAFMKSKGLKAETVKYTNIDPAARIGMLVTKKIPAIETFAMSMPGVVKAAGRSEAQMFLLADAGLSLYSNGILVREDYLKAERAEGEGRSSRLRSRAGRTPSPTRRRPPTSWRSISRASMLMWCFRRSSSSIRW